MKAKAAKAKPAKQHALTIADLKPASYNPRKVSDSALAGLKVSLAQFGDVSGLVWNRRSGNLVAGHQRLRALKEQHGDALAMEGGEIVTPSGERFKVRIVDWPDAKERLANIAANNPGIAGEYTDTVGDILRDLQTTDMAELIAPLCLDELLPNPASSGGGGAEGMRETLAERFGVPPFSVLDARQGYWQERKRKWLALGIQSELGRRGRVG